MSGTTEKEQIDAEKQKRIDEGAAYINEIVTRARSGDESVVPRLRELLDSHPELWTSTQNLSECALFTWANLICGKDLVLREAIIRDFRLRVECLMSAEPGQMERMLATQVGFFRMQLLHAETVLGQMSAQGFTKASETVDKRITAAQKRLSRAQKDLRAFQKASGVEPVSKSANRQGHAETELDPAQRAAAEVDTSPNRQSAQETANPVPDSTTEVPLKPPVPGTERVVTSKNVLEENEVPNDSVFSALFDNPQADVDHDADLNEESRRKSKDREKLRQQVRS